MSDNAHMGLPELRHELSVYAGPDKVSGEPTWNIYDPARNLYFSLDWLTFEVLCRWGLGDLELIREAVNSETPLSLSQPQIEDVLDFLTRHELVKGTSAQDSARYNKIENSRKQGWYKLLVHSYLFFRIPLWNPNQWLGKTVSKVSWLGRRSFFLLTLLVLFSGLIQVIRLWDEFSATLIDLFSIKGLLAYGITLIFVKFVHELGHAYTAKKFGCRVPAMGIAFLVMFPMAYTDVNDVWKLRSRRQRLLVGGAGILTELSIAAWATLAWVLLPEGGLKTAAFLLATTTWVSTLAVNLSPFLRFDGYFLLMDYLEYPNLHARSFALARWYLRRKLFALPDPKPESNSPARQNFLLIFAFGTWCYRLIVFGGIAILVYLMFPKPLGPLLAAIEIYWFIIKPIWSEVRVWVQRWRDILQSKRFKWITGLVISFILVISLPWDARIHTQGVLKPAYTHYLTLTSAAQVKEIHFHSGNLVHQGQVLLQLSAPELDAKLVAAEERERRLNWQIRSGTANHEQLSQVPILKSQLQQVRTEIAGLNQYIEKLQIKTNQSGLLRWNNLDLQPGDWLQANERLGQVDALDAFHVNAYVDQGDVKRIKEGSKALFISDAGAVDPIPLTVHRVDSDAVRVLEDEILASAHGGEVLVREQSKQLIPENHIYLIALKPASEAIVDSELPYLRGRVVIKGQPEAWLAPFWRSLVATLRREAGF